MNRLRTTPIVAAALALVAVVLLASAASAAPTAPLFTTLDDFNRPDEDPLSGGGNWAQTDSGPWPTPMRIVNNSATRGSNGSASYWTQLSFAGGEGSVWARSGNLSVPTAPGVSIALYKDAGGSNAVDGYEFRRTAEGAPGDRFDRLYRVTNGARAEIATSGPNGAGTSDAYFNLRRVGNSVEAYTSSNGTSWTFRRSATDGTHTTGTYRASIHANITGTGHFVDDFGAQGSAPPSGNPPEQTFGTDENGEGVHCGSGSATIADPVNTRTGAFTTALGDVALPGTGVGFSWSRSYTSADPTVGRLGPGWTDSYSASLAVQGNGDVRLHGEDGQQAYYTKQGASFIEPAGCRSVLSVIAGGYELKRADQALYTFDASGRLLSMKDRNTQGVTLAYDGAGKLTTITDAAGKVVTVAYNASSLVGSVTTQDGRSVAYGYTSGRLTSVTDVRGKTWTYTYDAAGRLATIVDPLTHTEITNVYGTDGRVTSQTDALGKTTTFAWDAATEVATATDANNKAWKHDYDAGILAKDTDPLNNVTQLAHDADINVSAVTSPTAQTTQMTYDAAGNLLTATAPPSLNNAQKTFVYNARNDPTQVTDARGKVTSYTYTAAGNVETVTQDGIQVAAYTYDTAGRVLTVTDGRGKVTTSTYFPTTGYLESSTDPLGNKTTYTYDAAGRVLTRVDPKGNCAGCTPANFTWSYTYNAAGQELTETNPLGQVTTNVYDDAGRLTSTTDARGNTTSFTYDNANRTLTETQPDPDGGGPLQAPVTTYTYDNVGNKLTETDPRGNTTTYAYDGANRLVSETAPDPDGAGPLPAPVTTSTYDANSNLASTVEPRGNVSGANPNDYRTSYTYDAAGRQLTTTDPLGNVTTNVYDAVGNLSSVTDPNSHVTAYTYDAAGRILTVVAPDLGVTTYTYDATGSVLTRTDALGRVTTYAYDDAGQLASETSPDPDGPGPQGPAVTTYTYDPNGNRLTLIDPNGNATGTAGDGVTTHGYDRANRLTSIDYADSTPDVTYTYDAVGNRLTMVDGVAGTQTRTYDNLDRLSTLTRGTATFSYVYDAAGNVTKRTYPDGVVTDYTYDPLNRMASLVNGTRTLTYAYDAASNLVTTTHPAQNGHVETRTYDNAGRLTRTRTVKGAATLVDTIYTRDPVGNPLTEVTTGAAPVTKTFGYDANDRLTSVCFQAGTCPGGADPFIRYTYDLVGNRLTEQRPAGTTSSTYDARDRLLTAGATSYTWDQNGNQLSAGSRTFVYDLANRLKSTTLAPTTTTYTYDGDSIRTQASTGTTNQSKTNFTWDVNHALPEVVREASGSDSLYRRYIYGLDAVWYSTTGNNSNAHHFHRDPLGSVRALTAQGGATNRTYDYEPFGLTRTQTGTSPQNFVKFTGEYEDPTGLYHLRARQYDPTSGRFLRSDPVDPGPGSTFVSAYVYSSCRPTTLVDPSGMSSTPATTGEEVAGLATSRLGYRFLTLVRTGGPPYPCLNTANANLSLIADSGQVLMYATFPNPPGAARRVFGKLNLATTENNRRETHSFVAWKSTFKSAVWQEIPPYRGNPGFVQIQFAGREPANPAIAIDPDDGDTYGGVHATVRHAVDGKWLNCTYAGRFGRRP